MTPDATERRNQVAATLAAMDTGWPIIAAELARIRADKVEQLVAAENEQTRGAVKQIDEVLQLPNNLRQELLSYANSLPDQGETA